ncbi:MAG: DUF4331 family protein [Chitinophagaceae bacterium]|nr:DUF4331 family protein [Chitinophagaceae bacterium]
MKYLNKGVLLFSLGALLLAGCDKDENEDNFDTTGTYVQKDQMARPAVNTVFVNTARKDEFNTTTPSLQNAAFNTQFQSVLTGFGYMQNALGQDKATFAGLLATDVLNVKTSGTTTFFDGTNVLTGRALADDVIDVELLLIFGGPTGAANPGLTSDNVGANDKAFSGTFPYLASPF